MTEATAVTKLKQPVVELSEKVVPVLVLNKSDGIISVKEGSDPYIDNLPPSLTAELVREKDTYDSTFYAASADAVGQVAAEGLRKHSKLDVVSAEISMGDFNSVSHEVTRSKTYNGIGGGDKEPVTKYGVLRTQIDIKGARSDSGHLKQVRAKIAELGAEILADK